MTEDVEERIGRAMALAEDEDYMESHERYDRIARAALAELTGVGSPVLFCPECGHVEPDIEALRASLSPTKD